MRYLLLSLLLAGCGSVSEAPTAAAPAVPSPAPNPGVLAPMASSIEALGPAQASLVYSRAALWSDVRPDLTGTVAQAVTASVAMGASTLYRVVAPLTDGGQAVVTTFGASSANQTSDCLSVLDNNLPAGPQFSALRVLAAAALPPEQRQLFKARRDAVPLPANGQTLSKVLKLADMQKYLDGTFDPKTFGFQAVASDLVGLNTSAQLIAGLRLDYPGGFAGETRVAQLSYPQLPSFQLLIPYSAPFGGTQTGDYPFTGNGYTASLTGTIPEWTLPRSGADLALGSTLVEIDQAGQRILRGTWNGRVWAGQLAQASRSPREPVERAATYRGVPVYVISRSGPVAFVSVTQPLPPGFLTEQSQLGRDEYRGQVTWEELEF